MAKFQVRNLGTLVGNGSLAWRDGPMDVKYKFSTFHNPNNDTIETKGLLSGDAQAMHSAFGRPDVELTIEDGRKFRASLASGGHSGDATIFLKSHPEEFLKNPHRK